MKSKVTEMGIGIKIGLILFPYLILVIVIGYIISPIFNINIIPFLFRLIIGIGLLVIGVIVLATSGIKIFKAFRKKELITNNFFSFVQHPMYSSYVFFIIPGLTLLFNSWLILSASILLYVILKLLIKEEEEYLLENFGDDYLNYKNKTGFVFPVKFNKP